MSEKFVVVVADKLSESGLRTLTEDDRFEVLLTNGWEPDEMREAMSKAHALIVRSATKVNREVLSGAPNLRIVGRAGVGVDNIDLGVATEYGIPVINAPEGNTVSAAELAMALIFAVARKVAEADASVRRGEWTRSLFGGMELRGKTLGLVGAGRIGAEVALRAQAFGMRTIAHDPYLSEERAEELGVERVSLPTVLAQADVVSLHVPLTPSTEGMIGASELRAMKPRAILINAARGEVVDEAALVQALESGEIAGAALDVYSTEPLPDGSPLRRAPNLVLTPHLGASTREAQELVAAEIAEGVRAALLEGDLSQALNAPAIGGDDLKYVRTLFDLAGKMGHVCGVLGQGGMRRVEISVAGVEEEILRPLSAAAMTGLLTPVVGARNVNYVNALHVAETRDIEISAVVFPPRPDYSQYLELSLETDKQTICIAGALLGDQLHPRIVLMDGYRLSVRPEGCLIVLRNKDVPGVIGKVGTLLAAHDVNIAEYRQARKTEGGPALAAISVDQRVGFDLLTALRELDEIIEACAVHFDG